MSSSSNVGGNEHKRKRLTQACELCRRKKIKCDGSKPACNNCKRLNNTCTYSSSNKKRGPRQGYIEMLEQRLAKMEQILLSDSGDSSNNIISNLAKSDEIDEQHDNGSSTANPTNYLAEKLKNNENDSETSNKMKHTTKDLYGETSPTSYSSLSSNYPSPNVHIPSQKLPLKPDNDKDSLPPIDVIEHMVDLYFKYLFPSTPIFIEHELRSDIRDRKCPEFLLFSLIAVSARFSDRPGIKHNPSWHAGEKYAEKARKMIIKAIDEPSIHNLQALLLICLHEYGCGRGPRSWMYGGMAIRMAIELGLHEELDDESDNDTPEKLENQESRRRLFWSVYMVDKISSAATGRPSVIQDRSCSVFLPSRLVGNNGDQYYSENLDGSQSAIFNVNGLQRSYLLSAGSMSTISPNNDLKSSSLNRRYCLDCFTYVIRAISLLGGVTDYINRKGKNIETSLPPYHPDAEFNKLDKAINDWYDQLPMHLKNTPANFEMYKNSKSCYDTQHFFLLHILQNTIIVLLHRPSLTMSDTLENETVQPELKSFIRKSVDKCMAAVDNVTVMLKGLDDNDLLPPYSTYFAYTVATVVVSASFSPHPEEAQKAKQALGVYFRVLLSARNLWAMADKLYFMIRDLYSIHSNVMRKNEIDNNIQTSQEPTETTQPVIQPAVQLTELPIQSTTTLSYPPLQMHQNIQHTIDPFGLPPMENINNSISDWTLPYYNSAMSSTTPHVGFASNEGQNIDFLTNVFQLPQGYDQPLLFPAYDPSVNYNIDNRKNL